MKVNDLTTVVHGTCLQGYLNATYDDIVETLGYPFEHGFDDMKCDAEWTIEFDDGSVATIYNWKNGKNYLGADGLDLCDIKQWNIGGNSMNVVHKVQHLINGAARKDYPQDQVVAFNI
jgi:major membrane immunogen (membrane-anchored lipoprotein)